MSARYTKTVVLVRLVHLLHIGPVKVAEFRDRMGVTEDRTWRRYLEDLRDAGMFFTVTGYGRHARIRLDEVKEMAS